MNIAIVKIVVGQGIWKKYVEFVGTSWWMANARLNRTKGARQMIKYTTDSYSTKIVKVEIDRETESSVWIKGQRHRTKKKSEFTQIHDSWKDAHCWLLSRAKSKLKYICERYEERLSDVNAIEKMTEPEGEEKCQS